MKNILILLSLLISSFAYGQLGAPLRKNIIFAEYSHWGMYSEKSLTLNYERIVARKGNINYYIRIGGGKWAGTWTDYYIYGFGPKFNLGFGAFLGKRSHHLDVQAGSEFYALSWRDADKQRQYPDAHATEFHFYALAGYRYQEPGRPLIFRLALATYGVATVALGFSF